MRGRRTGLILGPFGAQNAGYVSLTSNRPGGVGEADVWVATRTCD